MFGNFQKIVLIIASVILILMLTIIGILIDRNEKKMKFPPVVPDCPDYWIDTSPDNSMKCENVKNLGSCNEKVMDFSTSFWKGSEGNCRKYKYARKCNITWDGITNNENICK